MLQAKKQPGLVYYDGRIFVAGSLKGDYIALEFLEYPTADEENLQWTFVSLLSYILSPY